MGSRFTRRGEVFRLIRGAVQRWWRGREARQDAQARVVPSLVESQVPVRGTDGARSPVTDPPGWDSAATRTWTPPVSSTTAGEAWRAFPGATEPVPAPSAEPISPKPQRAASPRSVRVDASSSNSLDDSKAARSLREAQKLLAEYQQKLAQARAGGAKSDVDNAKEIATDPDRSLTEKNKALQLVFQPWDHAYQSAHGDRKTTESRSSSANLAATSAEKWKEPDAEIWVQAANAWKTVEACIKEWKIGTFQTTQALSQIIRPIQIGALQESLEARINDEMNKAEQALQSYSDKKKESDEWLRNQKGVGEARNTHVEIQRDVKGVFYDGNKRVSPNEWDQEKLLEVREKASAEAAEWDRVASGCGGYLGQFKVPDFPTSLLNIRQELASASICKLLGSNEVSRLRNRCNDVEKTLNNANEVFGSAIEPLSQLREAAYKTEIYARRTAEGLDQKIGLCSYRPAKGGFVESVAVRPSGLVTVTNPVRERVSVGSAATSKVGK